MAGAGSLPPCDKILLVEGQDDKHVVRHLCDRHGSMPTFHTLDKGGVDKLLAAIGPEIKSPGRKVVGIVVDANDDWKSRWDAVADKLKEANIQPPSVPHDDGTIICEVPRIGIWLMPNNRSSGELEDFVRTMIPSEDPVWPLSVIYIDNIPVAARKFAADKALRAKLYAWLATREAPGRMGSAIGRGYLGVDDGPGATFVDWLQRLFR